MRSVITWSLASILFTLAVFSFAGEQAFSTAYWDGGPAPPPPGLWSDSQNEGTNTPVEVGALDAGPIPSQGWIMHGQRMYIYGTFDQGGGEVIVDYLVFIGGSGYYEMTGGSLTIVGPYLGNPDIGLTITDNGMMNVDVSGIDYFRIGGDCVGELEGYIGDGKLYDSSIYHAAYLEAYYDSANNWTSLRAVPEPGTIIMIGAGLAAAAGTIRRSMRKYK
jgi:hypothetical protein